MIVVVDIPDADAVAALLFAGVDAGAEDFVDQDLLVAFDLAAMFRGVGLDLLMPPGKGLDSSGEAVGAVARAVVGDDSGVAGDAVVAEPRFVVGFEGILGALLAVVDSDAVTIIHGGVQ